MSSPNTTLTCPMMFCLGRNSCTDPRFQPNVQHNCKHRTPATEAQGVVTSISASCPPCGCQYRNHPGAGRNVDGQLGRHPTSQASSHTTLSERSPAGEAHLAHTWDRADTLWNICWNVQLTAAKWSSLWHSRSTALARHSQSRADRELWARYRATGAPTAVLQEEWRTVSPMDSYVICNSHCVPVFFLI